MNIQDAKGITGMNEAAEVLTRQRKAFILAGPPSLADRRRDIEKLRDAIRSDAEAFAEAICADFGCRPRQETLLAEIWPILAAARHTLNNLGGWMRPKSVGVGLELLPGRARVQCQPVGVVGIISPWNYPVQLALMPLLAALAAGNRIMLKPSELTPKTSALLAQFLSGLFPEEQAAVVLGGAEIGSGFAGLPFDHLLFTGSTAVGRRVMQAAAPNLTPVTLELGGKSPCIVAGDADMAKASASIAGGKLLNAGQTCIAPDYVFVPKDRCEEFLALYRSAAQKLYPSLDGNADYTSIVSEPHYDRLMRMIEEARSRGARVEEIAPAGQAPSASGRKVAPTLVVDPDDDLALMRDEIFGPVLPVKTYGAIEEAIAYVNAHPRPLALYYFGRNAENRDLVLARTTSGGVTVNDTLMHIVVENLPFGGVGASGMGAYHGEDGFRTFSHRKGIFLQSRLNSRSLLAPPYGRVFETMLKFLLRR